MKKIVLRIIIVSFTAFILFACNEDFLNKDPLTTATTENWFQNAEQIEMSLNSLYDLNYFDEWWDWTVVTDDAIARTRLQEITSGQITATSSQINNYWSWFYEAIQNANRIIENIDDAPITDELKNRYKSEAKFHRAVHYSKLIFLWGDVPFYKNTISVEEAFELSRKDKNEILKEIYQDFDDAADKLPIAYSSDELKRATKGAALAMKARTALYMEDWATARDAAKACIDLEIYELHPVYEEIFNYKIGGKKGILMQIPRSVEHGVTINRYSNQLTPRTLGGFNVIHPSWQLLASYLCTDGLPIDESPLFDPHNPFKNRDPRCTKTIVEFGTIIDGAVYEPHPDTLVVYNSNTGTYVNNVDSRGVHLFASFNGLQWRKWVDGLTEEYNTVRAAPPAIVIRYADVLLIYAEAKIELNEIDQSVLDAINTVRERAYNQSEIPYPQVTTTIQSEARYQLRMERRMEFAFEGFRRYADLIRWRIADKTLSLPTWGIHGSGPEIREKHTEPGLWFWGDTPPIDENGIADFEATEMYEVDAIRWLALQDFPERQYLWPIPASEILINPNLTQNPGY